jgi:hypothetical protein
MRQHPDKKFSQNYHQTTIKLHARQIIGQFLLLYDRLCKKVKICHYDCKIIIDGKARCPEESLAFNRNIKNRGNLAEKLYLHVLCKLING